MNTVATRTIDSGIRIARASELAFTPVPPLRGGTIVFKTLLEGTEGTPDNYHMLLADTAIDFKSPRHRHNFDQLRYALVGSTNIGPKKNLEPGDVAYFPEGTHYGPQDQEQVGATSLTMVIQFGGPSGNGYMSRKQLTSGFDQLASVGKFEGGVYKRNAPADGERKNQDAYEAIWEAQNGRPVSYEKPRYLDSVHMRENHFDWIAQPGENGVFRKHLGSFTECGIRLDFVRLEPGARHPLKQKAQTQLLFVKDGTGMFSGDAPWDPHTAVHVPAGQTIAMQATTRSDIMVISLPAF